MVPGADTSIEPVSGGSFALRYAVRRGVQWSEPRTVVANRRFFRQPAEFAGEQENVSHHQRCTVCASQRLQLARAFEGFKTLEAWCKSCRAGQRPTDGYYVTLWRLMLRYPELLAWEQLWHDSLRETYAAIHAKVKSIKPSVGVGRRSLIA